MDSINGIEDRKTPPKREWVKNPKGIPEIYTNYLHPSWSLYDVRVLLGQLKPILGEGSDFVVEEQAAVTFSWGQAKNLAVALAELVRAYEYVNGEIPQLNLAPTAEEMKQHEG